MNIFIDENIPLLAEALEPALPPEFSIHRFQGRSLSRSDLHSCLMLCVRSTTRVNPALLEGTPVRFVGTATSGTEHIDTTYLRASGRVFADAKGCNANSVAEYVVFALLHWEYQQAQSLWGKTIGIVGYGSIGRRVAEMAYKLGLRICVYDPPFRAMGGRFAEYCREVSFEELLMQSNIVTNHVPMIENAGASNTLNLFNEQALERLQPKSLFIHASRGGIVKEDALLRVVQEKSIVLVCDVWESEPSVHADLVRECCIATPHIAGYSFEGKVNGSVMMAKACSDFLAEFLNRRLDADWSIFEQVLSDRYLPPIHFDDHIGLYKELQKSRAFEDDSARFLATFTMPYPEREFDALRKNYPVRREILLG